MNVVWVISQDIPNNLINPATIKDTGTSWGSWKTYSMYKTDNCVCSSSHEASALVHHSFHNKCQLHITKESFIELNRPEGVILFDGKFGNQAISNKDDIVTLNLIAGTADLVLLVGFNFKPLLNTDEEWERNSRAEYYFNMREIIKAHSSTQFVLVDYRHELASWVQELDNVTEDTVESVKSLLG